MGFFVGVYCFEVEYVVNDWVFGGDVVVVVNFVGYVCIFECDVYVVVFGDVDLSVVYLVVVFEVF